MHANVNSEYNLRTASDVFVTFLYAAAVHLVIAHFLQPGQLESGQQRDHMLVWESGLVLLFILFLFSDWIGRVRLPRLLPPDDQIGVIKQLAKTVLELSGLFCLVLACLATIEKSDSAWSDNFWLAHLNANRSFAVFLFLTFIWNLLMLWVMKQVSWLDLARLGMSGTAADSEKAKIYAQRFLQYREKGGTWVPKDRVWSYLIRTPFKMFTEAGVRTIAQIVAFHIAWASLFACVIIWYVAARPGSESVVSAIGKDLSLLGRWKYALASFLVFIAVIPIINLIKKRKTRVLSFRDNEVVDPDELLKKLSNSQLPVSKHLQTKFLAHFSQILQSEKPPQPEKPQQSEKSQLDLVTWLNQLIKGGRLYDEIAFIQVELRAEAQQLITKGVTDGEHLERLNRLLMIDAYPEEIVERRRPENILFSVILLLLYVIGFCGFVFFVAAISFRVSHSCRYHFDFWGRSIPLGWILFVLASFLITLGPFALAAGIKEGSTKPLMRVGGTAVAMVMLSSYLLVGPTALILIVGIQQMLVNGFLQFAASERRIVVRVVPSRVILSTPSQQFVAAVFGTEKKEIYWEAPFGTIDQNGLYTPPWIPGTFTVRAVSREDESRFGEATVLVPEESRRFDLRKTKVRNEGETPGSVA